MIGAEILRGEISAYLILSGQLKARFGEIDDATLADTLEGVSDLPDLITKIVRSGLEDDVFVAALKQRIDEMQCRLSRLKDRYEKKRALAAWAMSQAEICRIQAPDFSLSLRPGSQRLEVSNESVLPTTFLIPQPSRIDRAGLSAALKRGEPVAGAALVQGDPIIAVRVS